MRRNHKKLLSLLGICLVVGGVFLGKNLVAAYSQGCVDEKKYIDSRQTILTNCKTQCASDKVSGVEPADADCTDVCSNETDNLNIANQSYANCLAASITPPPTPTPAPAPATPVQTTSSEVSLPASTPSSSINSVITSLDSYVASLSSLLHFDSSTDVSVSHIIQKYCDALNQTPPFATPDVVYNPKQSAFVFLLCNRVQASIVYGFDDAFQKAFKQLTFADLGIAGAGCTSSQMNACDLSSKLPGVFNTLLDDYSNIKEASLYGATSGSYDKNGLATAASTFAATYFTPAIHLCDQGTRYPNTCRLMKNYIQDGSKTFNDQIILNSSAIATWAKHIPASACALGTVDYDMFPCALLADTGTSLEGFTSLVYNELFYYRLFVNYYLLMLSANPQILSTNPQVATRNVTDQQKRFTDELLWSQKAITLTLRAFRDIYTAFPLHIGFMLYQEDLYAFGKRLASLGAPLYTLYDKLRNVQQP